VALGCVKGEGQNDLVNPDRPLWMTHPSGALALVFRRPLTVSGRTPGESYERGRAAIDPHRGRVFVGSSDRGLYALRADSGSSIWRFENVGAVQSEPLYDRDLDFVYFGSNDGALYAVRASDGSLVWRFASGAEVARSPVLVGETLYFANAGDTVFGVDRRTGKSVWPSQHRTPALGMEIAGYAGPVVDRGLVIMAYSDGHVMAYDARDGSEKWPLSVDLAAEAEQGLAVTETLRYLDVDTTPVVDDGPRGGRVAYVASYAGGVFALDEDSGTPVWKNDRATGVYDLVLWTEPEHAVPVSVAPKVPPGATLPKVGQRKLLFAASATTGLWALDPATGQKVWRIAVPEGGMTAPVAVAGAMLVGTSRYGLFLLAPRTGEVIDSVDLGTGFSSPPAVYGRRAYALSNGGTFLGLQVEPPTLRDRASVHVPPLMHAE
jgi:outer membrane protein assembly factor BamB